MEKTGQLRSLVSADPGYVEDSCRKAWRRRPEGAMTANR